MGNEKLQREFIDNLVGVSDTTKYEYNTKLNQLTSKVKFDAEESDLLEFLAKIKNPNTRTNKAFALIRLRRYHKLPVVELEQMREDTKEEIRTHRKAKSKEDNEALVSYEELLKALDEMQGRDYFMNYMYVHHGLRNRDINVRYRPNLSKATKNENLISFNPKAKNPKVTLYITDYKTASTYGPKTITIKNQRLFDELTGMKMKNGDYVFKQANGQKPTINYMNVLASKHSINNYGEGRIAKILIKHLLDTKRFSDIEELSQQRGTSLSTLYTVYNTQSH
jgi:integrase